MFALSPALIASINLSKQNLYLTFVGIALALAIFTALLWKTSFPADDPAAQKAAKLWSVSFLIGGVFLMAFGGFTYLTLEEFSLSVVIIEAVGLGLIIAMIWVGSFRFDAAFSSATFFSGVSLFTLFLAFLVIAYLNTLSVQKPLKYDFNLNKLESLSPETANVLKNLREPVEVVGFFLEREKAFEQGVREFLETYRAENREKFSYRMINPLEEPQLAACYGIKYDMGTEGRPSKRLVLAKGSCKPGVPAGKDAAKGYTFAGKKITLEKLPPDEQEVTNKLIQISRPSKKLCFLTGHNQPSLQDEGEFGYKSLGEQLKNKGFEVLAWDLFAKNELPKDCAVLIQALPEVLTIQRNEVEAARLTDREAQIVKKYLEEGGKLLLFQEPLLRSNLEDVLQTYGVTALPGLVVDFYSNPPTQSGAGNPQIPIVREFDKDHPITKGMTGRAQTILRQASAFEISKALPTGVSVHSLMQTFRIQARLSDRVITCCSFYIPNPNDPSFVSLMRASRAWLRQTVLNNVVSGIVEKNVPGVRPGPFPLGVAIAKKVKDSAKEMRIVAFSDSGIAGNALLQANEALLLNSLAWLAEESDLISIPPKQRKPSNLQISKVQRNLIRYSTRYGMPLFFGFLILFVMAIRREK